jgi:hypothetical protein
MDKFTSAIVGIVLTAAFISFFAVLGGTIVWLIWPVAIPAAFPKIVEMNYIAAQISWWQAVCLCWICGLLIKSSYSSSK